MSRGLYAADLERLQCANPDCDHSAHDGLYLSSKCHPRNALYAFYQAGELRITCARCGRAVCTIAVALGPDMAEAITRRH